MYTRRLYLSSEYSTTITINDQHVVVTQDLGLSLLRTHSQTDVARSERHSLGWKMSVLESDLALYESNQPQKVRKGEIWSLDCFLFGDERQLGEGEGAFLRFVAYTAAI